MKRTVVAALLTAGALGLPMSFWFVSGSREAEREARRVAAEPAEAAAAEAGRLAQVLAARLEALRASEERRPFYHYQNLYHEPKGAYEGQSVVPSPLAAGPQDPLVRAYFQADAEGKVTLPTLNEEVPEAASAQMEAQRRIQQEIASSSGLLSRRQATQSSQVQTLSEEAWQQNSAANRIFKEVRQKGKASPEASRAVQGPDQDGQVRVSVGAMGWATAPVAGRDCLMAVREITNPSGEFTQGFQVSERGLGELLKASAFPASLLQGAPAGPGEAALPLEGVAWKVSVDASAKAAQARARAEVLKGRFHRTFLAVSSLAGLAGLCVVGLVLQSERLAAERSRFAASAAHELRTPLAGLRMYGEMLADGLGDPARAKDYAKRVASEAERLGRVVANVLGFTRLERGALSVSVRPEALDLAAAVREACARLAPAVEAAGATLAVEAPEGLPPARFDRDALFQILQNLVDNAEKYGRTSADRTITVAVGVVGSSPLGLALSVTDRGPGVPASLGRRLFRPFARTADPDAPQGLGLGLAMTRALARAQGGEAAWERAPGGGSRFTVSFETEARKGGKA